MASVAPTKPYPHEFPGFSGVTVRPLTNIPSRVDVRLLELVAAAHFTVDGTEGDLQYCVLSGSGWTEWSGQTRVQITVGNIVFVRNDDRVTIGTNTGLTLLQVTADLMMPST